MCSLDVREDTRRPAKGGSLHLTTRETATLRTAMQALDALLQAPDVSTGMQSLAALLVQLRELRKTLP